MFQSHQKLFETILQTNHYRHIALNVSVFCQMYVDQTMNNDSAQANSMLKYAR